MMHGQQNIIMYFIFIDLFQFLALVCYFNMFRLIHVAIIRKLTEGSCLVKNV